MKGQSVETKYLLKNWTNSNTKLMQPKREPNNGRE